MRRKGDFEHLRNRGGLDPAELSGLIGPIYDCVLKPAGWEAALGAVAERFDFANATLSLTQIRRAVHQVQVNHRFDEEWVALFPSYLAESLELWGGAARIQSYPLDEPIVSSSVLPPEARPANRYYREVLEPRGIADAVGIAVAREQQLIGYLALNRHVEKGPIGDREVEGLRLIAPHIRRAVTIADLFDLKAVESATFRSVLDGLSCAVVLVDDYLRIVHANPAGEAMLAAGDLMQIAQGRLSICGRIAEDALRAAVRIASEDEAQLSQRGIGIPAVGADGSGAVLHVLPLSRRNPRPGLAQRAVAAIFAVSGGMNPPVDAIATLYDLTPAESQIFASLCRGTSLEETAEALGIAKSTARTHLLRVFAKTGCSRQAELVALAARLSLSL